MDNVRTRGFRFLLYPDNRDHMNVLKAIKRDSDYHKFYVGIWHELPDTKKHSHVILYFDNPRSWKNICKSLNCDERFCRPIGYEVDKKSPDHWKRCSKKDNIEKACAYLPHFTDLDKEQYQLSDLWGFPTMVDWCKKNCIRYQSKNLSQADCLIAARTWICGHFGHVITPMMLVKWLTESPYMKIANSSLLRMMVDQHNNTVLRNEARSNGFDVVAAREAYEERIQAERDRETRELVRALESGELKLDDFYTIE